VGELVVVLADEGGELLEVGAALGGDGGVDVVFGGFRDCGGVVRR
jgi:hypothetical protein